MAEALVATAAAMGGPTGSSSERPLSSTGRSHDRPQRRTSAGAPFDSGGGGGGPRRLSLASSCGSASSAKKVLFTEEPQPGRGALGELSFGAVNAGMSATSASSPPPAAALTPSSASGPTEAPAPRSVLRRRTPGHAQGGGGGHISFDPAHTKLDPSPSSLVKHSPRPPRWPAAQSPWLHRGAELPPDDAPSSHRAAWETPKDDWLREDLPRASKSRQTPAAGPADSTRTVQDELLASASSQH
jgi:hypothetical protein